MDRVYGVGYGRRMTIDELLDQAASRIRRYAPHDARDAAAASGLLARYGLAAAQLQLGISGEKVSPECLLHEGDRVEILRPLAIDPREARRRRARKTRV